MSLVVQLCRNVYCIHGICRDAGGMNVIRMADAVRVIRDDHLRPIMFDELCDSGGCGLDGHTAESAFAVGIPPRHA